MNTAFENITKKTELISLPDIYFRLREVLDDPDFAMAEVAIVISQDPAITLRLLHLVNSSFYGFSNKIETVSRAITLLGTEQIHDLVLATAVARAFEGMSTSVMDMQTFWQRSICCAVISRKLAVLSGKRDKERLFVAGLLHDIGHLIMYQVIPDLSQQAILQAKERNELIHMTERRLIGFDYARVGGVLMRHWLLPESLIETTMLHVEPTESLNYSIETALVHLGSMLTEAHLGDGVFNEGILSIDAPVWVSSGLVPEDCAAIQDEVEEDINQVMEVIFPRESLV